jgi:hypothetical protein
MVKISGDCHGLSKTRGWLIQLLYCFLFCFEADVSESVCRHVTLPSDFPGSTPVMRYLSL